TTSSIRELARVGACCGKAKGTLIRHKSTGMVRRRRTIVMECLRDGFGLQYTSGQITEQTSRSGIYSERYIRGRKKGTESVAVPGRGTGQLNLRELNRCKYAAMLKWCSIAGWRPRSERA